MTHSNTAKGIPNYVGLFIENSLLLPVVTCL